MNRYFRNFRAIIISLAVLAAVFSCSKTPNEVSTIYFTNVQKGNVHMNVGETFRVKYMVEPIELQETAEIEWTTSKKMVATVKNGRVTAVGVGKATITATCGEISASFEVEVRLINATHFNLPAQVSGYIGAPANVAVTDLQPEGASVSSITWSIQDESVATYSIEAGVLQITGHKKGSTKLIGKIENLTRECTVNVYEYVPVQSITVTLAKTSIGINTSTNVTLKVLPDNASVKDVEWSLSSELAQFDSKTMTVTAGDQTGTVTITAKSQNEDVSGSATLTITPPRAEKFSISAPENNKYCHICPDASISGYPKTVKLVQTITPSGVNPSITWTSSDTKVATVAEDGTVTAVGHGVAVIKAVADDLESTCVVRSMKNSEVKWCRSYLPPLSSTLSELSALYQPKESLGFYFWDPASKYTWNGKTDYDQYFFYYKDGKFVKPTISAPAGVTSWSYEGLINLASAVPVEGNVTINCGIGNPIIMKLDTHIRSASLCRSDMGNITVYKTVQNGSTVTVSKADLPGAYGNGEGLIVYCNGAAGYSSSLSTYLYEFSCDALGSYLDNEGYCSISLYKSLPNGTYTLKCEDFDTSFSFSIKVTD